MPVGRGYKIPDEPQPENNRCLRIYIPDDDLYLYAFMGAYQYFTQWTAWERDDSHRGSLAAAAWLNAYEQTLSEGIDGCISEMDLQELIDTITNCCISFTSRWDITNTRLQAIVDALGNISGVGGVELCIPCEEVVVTPPISDPPVDPNDPPVGDTPAGYLAELCRTAQYVYDQYVVQSFQDIYYLQTTASELFTAAYIQALMSIPGIGFPITVVINLVNFFINIINSNNYAQTLSDLGDLRDNVVCIIYNNSSAEAAIAALTNYFGLVDALEAEMFITQIMNTNTLNGIYSGSIDVPAAYEGLTDCSECVGSLGNAWQPIDEILDPSSSYVFTSPGLTEWFMAGNLVRGTSTDIEWRSENDYDHEAITAVSFIVDQFDTDRSPGWATGDSGFFFGGPNFKTQLAEVVANDESVLLWLTGTTQPSGTFDHVFEVNDDRYLDGLFIIKHFTTNPPPMDVVAQITNFQTYNNP